MTASEGAAPDPFDPRLYDAADPDPWLALYLDHSLPIDPPAKRALLTTHLKTPVMPTSPSERAWNLWEYVRIGAEDAGVAPTASDSVEELLARIEQDGHARSPALEQAAEIYARSRYGFVLRPGDALSMRKPAMLAFIELRRDMTVWQRVKSWWRPLS